MNSRQTTNFVADTSSSVNKSNQNYDTIKNYIKGDLGLFKYPMQTVLDNQTAAAGKIVACDMDYYSAYFKEKSVLK